jgi:hypothetical protein
MSPPAPAVSPMVHRAIWCPEVSTFVTSAAGAITYLMLAIVTSATPKPATKLNSAKSTAFTTARSLSEALRGQGFNHGHRRTAIALPDSMLRRVRQIEVPNR